MTATRRTACLVCGGGKLVEVIDLGLHPCADTFLRPEEADEETLWPLVVDRCEACGQVQTRIVIDPETRYSSVDYAYTSANSGTSRQHWLNFAETFATPDGVVLDVGSNDGFLAWCFRERGCWVLGVDPSPAMAVQALSREIGTITACFGTDLVEEIRHWTPPPTLITANNVLNHANDPVDFVKAVAKLLAKDGLFVCEVPAWETLVASGRPDQIYHEHVTYWTRRTIQQLFAAGGLTLIDAVLVDYHGGSWRCVGCRGGWPIDTPADPTEYDDHFRQQVHRNRSQFLREFYTRIDRDPDPVVCVGAAAKGNTFLNYYHLDHTLISCVTDAAPEKIGKLTPGTHIPIRPDSALAELDHPYAILTAWNLAEPLKQTLAAINPHITYLYPYGVPR